MSPDAPIQEPETNSPPDSDAPLAGTAQAPLTAILDAFENMDRPSVLQHQVDPLVAETLLSELRTEKMYEHVIDGELKHEAWRLSDTDSETIVEITVMDGDTERTNYAKPPAGVAFMDVRWWALNCKLNDRDFVVGHIRNKELNAILQSSPPEWRESLSVLLDRSFGHATLDN